jgi:hypothetical protein
MAFLQILKKLDNNLRRDSYPPMLNEKVIQLKEYESEATTHFDNRSIWYE